MSRGTMDKSETGSVLQFVCRVVFFPLIWASSNNLVSVTCPTLTAVNGNLYTHSTRNTLAELNVCHSTFGICFQKDLDVGRGNVSLLVLVPANSRPAVSFVLLYDVQQLALCHGDGALVMTCENGERGDEAWGNYLELMLWRWRLICQSNFLRVKRKLTTEVWISNISTCKIWL